MEGQRGEEGRGLVNEEGRGGGRRAISKRALGMRVDPTGWLSSSSAPGRLGVRVGRIGWDGGVMLGLVLGNVARTTGLWMDSGGGRQRDVGG